MGRGRRLAGRLDDGRTPAGPAALGRRAGRAGGRSAAAGAVRGALVRESRIGRMVAGVSPPGRADVVAGAERDERRANRSDRRGRGPAGLDAPGVNPTAVERLALYFGGLRTRQGLLARAALGTPGTGDEQLARELAARLAAELRPDGTVGGGALP